MGFRTIQHTMLGFSVFAMSELSKHINIIYTSLYILYRKAEEDNEK